MFSMSLQFATATAVDCFRRDVVGAPVSSLAMHHNNTINDKVSHSSRPYATFTVSRLKAARPAERLAAIDRSTCIISTLPNRPRLVFLQKLLFKLVSSLLLAVLMMGMMAVTSAIDHTHTVVSSSCDGPFIACLYSSNHHQHSTLAVFASAAAAPTSADADPRVHKVITMGYLRMAGIDDEGLLAGFLATIRAANVKNYAADLGYTIKLDVVTIECPDVLRCSDSLASIDRDYVTPEILAMATVHGNSNRSQALDWSLHNASLYNTTLPADPEDGESVLLAFFARMPFYTAVIRPNYVVAPRVVAHAQRVGIAMMGNYDSPAALAFLNNFGGESESPSSNFLPIISPISIAQQDFAAGSENLIHFEAYIGNQLSHIFTFMQQSAGCGISGIVFQQFSEMSRHVASVQAMFTDGGLPRPPALDVSNVTDDALLDFFLYADERRRCFVALTTSNTLVSIIERLSNASNGAYVPSENKFFGTTLLSSNRFKLSNGDTSVFDLHYTRWSPQYQSTDSSYQVPAAADMALVFWAWYNASIRPNINSNGILTWYGSTASGNGGKLEFVSSLANTPNGSANFAGLRIDGTGAATASGNDLNGFSSMYETVPSKPSDSVFAAYLMMSFVIDAIRGTLGNIGHTNLRPPTSTSLPIFNETSSGAVYNTPAFASSTFSATDAVFSFTSPHLFMAADNVTSVQVSILAFTSLLSYFFDETRTIGGFQFYSLVRACSPKPLPQLCYCNSGPRTSYIYYVDGSINLNPATRSNSMNGVPAVAYDNLSLGQRNMATVSFPTTCGYSTSSWSYPITGLFFLPEITVEVLATDIFQATFGEMTRNMNYAANTPARPFRYFPFTISTTESTARVMTSYIDSYRPFVIFGSLQANILNSTVLTIYPALRFEVEDPVLLPLQNSKYNNQSVAGAGGTASSSSSSTAQYWQPNLLKLQPVLADYIHAMVSYYAQNAATLFSGFPIRALATSQREAELISLSFGTFGYLVPVSSIVVSTDPAVWEAKVTEWLSAQHPLGYVSTVSAGSSSTVVGGYRGSIFIYRVPFVLLASALNANQCVVRAFAAAKLVDRGILGVASGDAVVYNATIGALNVSTDTLQWNPNSSIPADESAIADIIFSAMAPEWWVANSRRFQGIPSSLDAYRDHPRFLTALLAFEFAQTLAQSVQQDYLTTAADVLYTTAPSITTRAGTFGPFSNDSCTMDVISANSHSRTCQCTKGPRTSWVHSLKDREALGYSERTQQFTYTMATCGVVYTPYVYPVVPAASLSRGTIAGIAVGASVAVISLITAGILVNALCFGRNNRAAPKDSTKAFTVVFTDIQSSTSLWARAPTAMSQAVDDHHRLIRKCLRRNNGYEVKTVGDSFMVAFKHMDDAILFSLDVQLTLHDASCWSTEIDAIYAELLMEAEADGGHGDEVDQHAAIHQYGHGHTDRRTTTLSSHTVSNSVSTAHITNNNNTNGNNNVNNNKFNSPCNHTTGNSVVQFSAFNSGQRTEESRGADGAGSSYGAGGPLERATDLMVGGHNHQPQHAVGTSLYTHHAATTANNNATANGNAIYRNSPSPANSQFTGLGGHQHQPQQQNARPTYTTYNYSPTSGGGITTFSPNLIVGHQDLAVRAASSGNRRPISASAGGASGAALVELLDSSLGRSGQHQGGGDGGNGAESSSSYSQQRHHHHHGGSNTNNNTTINHNNYNNNINTNNNNNASRVFELSLTNSPSPMNGNANGTTSKRSGLAMIASGNSPNRGGVGPVVTEVPPTTNSPSSIHYPSKPLFTPTSVTNPNAAAGEESDCNTCTAAAAAAAADGMSDVHNNPIPILTTVSGSSRAILMDAMAAVEKSVPLQQQQRDAFGRSLVACGAGGETSTIIMTAPNHPNHNMNGTVAHTATDYTMDSLTNKVFWHGLRVRIGIHYGMGDIRKDPVTLGYDYYGTVVNTAARVEGVGHGGQVLVTEEAFNAISDGVLRRNSATSIALGPQPLRGLDEPIRLFQIVPLGLQGRRFPPLRLHIEKDTEDSDITETSTQTASTSDKLTPEELAVKICSGKQYYGITAENLILQYYFFLAAFAPTTEKYRASVIAKLGETWGFEKASKAANVSNEAIRTRLLVGMLAKIIKTFRASRKVKGVKQFGGGGTTTVGGGSTLNGGRGGTVATTESINDEVASSHHNATSSHHHQQQVGTTGAHFSNNTIYVVGSGGAGCGSNGNNRSPAHPAVTVGAVVDGAQSVVSADAVVSRASGQRASATMFV